MWTRIWVEGIVQGVGFRPVVHALATRLDLTGLVGNDSAGVLIEVEGSGRRSASSATRWSARRRR